VLGSVRAFSQALHAANTYRPRFQVWTRPSYFEAVAHESTILSFPPPTCIAHPGAILLHDYWTVYDSPSDLPCVCYTPYNIGNNNIVEISSEDA